MLKKCAGETTIKTTIWPLQQPNCGPWQSLYWQHIICTWPKKRIIAGLQVGMGQWEFNSLQKTKESLNGTLHFSNWTGQKGNVQHTDRPQSCHHSSSMPFELQSICTCEQKMAVGKRQSTLPSLSRDSLIQIAMPTRSRQEAARGQASVIDSWCKQIFSIRVRPEIHFNKMNLTLNCLPELFFKFDFCYIYCPIYFWQLLDWLGYWCIRHFGQMVCSLCCSEIRFPT